MPASGSRISETRQGWCGATWHSAGCGPQDGRPSYGPLARPLTKCLIAFQDRFYKPDDRHRDFRGDQSEPHSWFPDSRFSGNVEEFSGRLAVVQIMTRLANMFQSNLQRAAIWNERIPTLKFSGQLQHHHGQHQVLPSNPQELDGELVRPGANGMDGQRSSTAGREAWMCFSLRHPQQRPHQDPGPREQ